MKTEHIVKTKRSADAETLLFPDGIKRGDVVYDLKSNPYAVGEHVMDSAAANIRYIDPIEKSVAEAMIKSGANKIVSTI